MSVTNMTNEQMLHTYGKTGQILRQVLQELNDQQLDLSPSEDKWSIRQIAHHIIDSDMIVQNIIIAALGSSGCHYDQTWYPTDNSWSETLNYGSRTLKSALCLFECSHNNLIELILNLKDPFERTVYVKIDKTPDWKEVSVRDLILSRLNHFNHHIQQITDIKNFQLTS